MDPISINEKTFIIEALKENQRSDGRSKLEIRPIAITLHRHNLETSSEIEIGETKVLCITTAEVVSPFTDRPNEGTLDFNLLFSPMAGREYYDTDLSELEIELKRILERSIKESDAIDLEALCLIPGDKVFSLQCSITVLNNAGNIIDACVLAATSCLSHYKRPDYSVENNTVKIYSSDEHNPVPLSIHHHPICITFGIFDDDMFVLDTNEREEAIQVGSISFILNAFGELCGIHKLGGIPIAQEDIITYAQIASTKVTEISKILFKNLKDSENQQ